MHETADGLVNTLHLDPFVMSLQGPDVGFGNGQKCWAQSYEFETPKCTSPQRPKILVAYHTVERFNLFLAAA